MTTNNEYSDEEPQASNPQKGANVASSGWKSGLAFGKTAVMPTKGWKKELEFGKVHDILKPVKEPRAKKPIAPISAKKKARMKNEGSEVDFFAGIWMKRQHVCEVCGKSIKTPKPECFAHRLSKGRYPEYRYEPKNVALVCSIHCHAEEDRRNAHNDKAIISSFSK